ncbi:MAG: NUDIX hydrolase [Flavobacteriales bacterium]
MNYTEFQQKIAKIEKMELPGEEIQLKMAPKERLLSIKRKAEKQKFAKQAGVLMLFYPSKKGLTYFALILRKTYNGVHSAQVGFPGGRYEKNDKSIKETALRETQEEIGVPGNTIKVLKKITEIYIPPSNFFVHPFIGITLTTPTFKIQEEEVEQLLEIDLNHFLNDNIKTTTIRSTSYTKNIKVPAFLLNNKLVWGATAMMLNEAREMLKKII